jgi:hypothetical protein
LRGWEDESLEGLEVIDLDLARRFPGAHSEMLIEPHVGIVAEKLHERLQTARAVFLESAAARRRIEDRTEPRTRSSGKFTRRRARQTLRTTCPASAYASFH